MAFSRRLLALGCGCLILALLFGVFLLPHEFPFLPASSFRTEILSVQPGRTGVEVVQPSQSRGDAAFIEWRIP